MPCRYNTFDGRLLWFDGVEGKRGLTLNVLLLLLLCVCVCVCVVVVVVVFLGGREGGQTVSLYSAYYAPNKFSSLLFSPGTLNGHVDNVV